MSVPTSAPALVDAAWCLDHLEDPAVRFVEVDERPHRRRYELGHIPGAISWNWSAQLSHPVNRDIAGPRQVEQLLHEGGIGRAMHIVLYGDPGNWFAAWAYWLLKLYGFDRVSLLDGGRTAWMRRGMPFSTEIPPTASAGDWQADGARDYRAMRADVLARLGDASAAIVDVRSVGEYRGELIAPALSAEGAQRGGHIPGAVSIPWDETVRPDGTFRPAPELRAMYGAAGVDSDKDVTVYCRIGERSSHTWFVLHELLGYPRVRNYDGSWTEWGSSVGLPIERGA